MDDGALPVRRWTDDGFTAPRPAAPAAAAGGAAARAGIGASTDIAAAAAAAAAAGSVRIVGVRGDGDRVAARRVIRRALAAALVESPGLPARAVRLVADSGTARFVSVSCESGGLRRIGLALSDGTCRPSGSTAGRP